jgi:phage gpG-like protein
MEIFNLLSAAAKFNGIARDFHMVEDGILTELAIEIRDRAKAVIGTEGYDWPELSASTIRKKGNDRILLDTGELRDSIAATVDVGAKRAWVGTNLDKGVWNELGTAKAPPRPFLLPSAMLAEKPFSTVLRLAAFP